MHSSKNSYLEIRNSSFEDNYSFGRGTVLYTEQEYSNTKIFNSQFRRNNGLQGGVFFIEKNARVTIEDSVFEDNFACQGGVLYLVNDVEMTINNAIFIGNFAFRASLFYLFNS